MSERGICEVCNKERVLRDIDSGQKICSACYRELKPPRPKDLAPYVTIEAYMQRGILLPETITREQVRQLKEDLDALHYLLMNAWYAIKQKGFDYSGGDRETLERACYALLQSGSFGQEMLLMERQRQDVGQREYDRIKDANKRKRYRGDEKPGFYVEDGVLYDGATDKDLATWDFKPALDKRAPYFNHLHDLLHEYFPAALPKRGLISRLFH